MTTARAEHFDTLQDILKLDIRTCTTEVCIAARRENESMPEFRRLRLAESVKEEFRELVAAALLTYHKELHLHNLQVLDFDVASQPQDYQVEHIDLSKQPYDNVLEQTQALTMLHSLETFKEELSFTRSMRFYVIILQPPQGQPLYFYRRYSPAKILNTPVALKRIFGNTDEFEAIKTPVFLFDKNIDCIRQDKNLFVLAKNHFYYMFQILDELISSAQDTLKLIRQRIPIENFSLFERSCKNNKRKMQKLTSIARRPYLSRLTIAHMKPTIKKHNLYIPIVEVKNSKQTTEMLHYDEEHPWDILKLLDDDYLTSIMTGQDYEVDAKRDP